MVPSPGAGNGTSHVSASTPNKTLTGKMEATVFHSGNILYHLSISLNVPICFFIGILQYFFSEYMSKHLFMNLIVKKKKVFNIEEY